mmetsp:Transcript_120984/g.270348  ORF Transcript_120984/g.270348 Transcript_120984/m.270348 type:complete len:197 (-) Transcript_120984:155-745(-)
MATCSVHGKKRSMQSMVVDETGGGYKCAPGCECKVGGAAAISGLDGTMACSVHGKMRSQEVLIDDGMGSKRCIPGKECKSAGMSANFGIKRSLCKFWSEGACQNAERCTYAHGEQELGQPILGDNVGGKGAGKAWGKMQMMMSFMEMMMNTGGGGGGKGWGKDAGKGGWGGDAWSGGSGASAGWGKGGGGSGYSPY